MHSHSTVDAHSYPYSHTYPSSHTCTHKTRTLAHARTHARERTHENARTRACTHVNARRHAGDPAADAAKSAYIIHIHTHILKYHPIIIVNRESSSSCSKACSGLSTSVQYHPRRTIRLHARVCVCVPVSVCVLCEGIHTPEHTCHDLAFTRISSKS